MDDWNNVRVLLAVIEAGSLTGAAEALGISTATVSRRLAAAEASLGTVLVERGPAGFRVTPVAAALVAPLRDAEQSLARAVQLARSGAGTQGVVTVAALPSVGSDVICPHLPRLYAAHPDIVVQLALHYRVVNLGRGDADIAVRSARPTQENLVMMRLATAPFRAFAATSLVERMGSDIASDLPWIGWPTHLDIDEQRWFAEHVPEDRVVLRVDQLHAQIRACQAGVGAALLSVPAARAYGGMVPVRGVPDGSSQPLWMAAPTAVRDLPRVDAVWHFIAETFEELVTAAMQVSDAPG
ncbi:MAG: LysR family transcriptional regulator [Myxococcales bacterium]|nr:LysR family transcriptional regulator [Myxococcales bacterium]